ncbi:hypothetical protein NDU88_000095 [Pleurodeles waltl]|uniref:Uncharacterized protein n=1 Tax=Pleurodeles waltl TaxID=8319 RepID=A0AAV7SVZ2_PLEWA|nr:hypothetical protein NDU88_000095 [Pleurodeles waltl]
MRLLNIRMGRRQASEKKRKIQCSPEPLRATLPSSTAHNVSSSGSQNNAERDHELEPLSGDLPNVILLSMLEQLEAKLDNLQNTLEDVPSRVAGLMEQLWIAKGQYHLVNGGVSLGLINPVTVTDCSFSRSSPIPLSVMAREQNHCLQRTSLDGHGPQQDCTVSRCPLPNVPIILGEPSLQLQPVIDDGEEPRQDQCTQVEPEEHVKKERLYADSWDPQQNFCLQPPFHDGHEPQLNQCGQPVLPDGKGPGEHIKQELLWFDGEDLHQNHCRQPAFEEDQSLQHNTCLQQVLSAVLEPHQTCKTEPVHPEAQIPDRSYKLEPLQPEDRDQDYDLQQLCTNAQGPCVSSSLLAQDTADTDGDTTADPLERGNMESDLLLLQASPAQQSQTESRNSKEKHKGCGGRKNFAHKMNERKYQRIHRSERFNNKTLLRHKRIHTGLGVYFTWNEDYYLQKTGTSMGNCAVPCFANLFMYEFEQDHIR